MTTELLFYHKQRSISQAKTRNATQIPRRRRAEILGATRHGSSPTGLSIRCCTVAERDGTGRAVRSGHPHRDSPRRPGPMAVLHVRPSTASAPSWTHVTEHASASPLPLSSRLLIAGIFCAGLPVWGILMLPTVEMHEVGTYIFGNKLSKLDPATKSEGFMLCLSIVYIYIYNFKIKFIGTKEQ
jgi:hypothetical protein